MNQANLDQKPTLEQIKIMWELLSSTSASHHHLEINTLITLVDELWHIHDDPSEVWRGLITALLADPVRLMY